MTGDRVSWVRRHAMPRTLRGRLLAGVLALVTIGFIGADVASYNLLHAYLDARANRNVMRVADGVDQALSRRLGLGQTRQVLQTVSAAVQVAFLDQAGRPVTILSPRPDRPVEQALTSLVGTGAPVDLRARPDQPVQVSLAEEPYRVVYHPTSGVLVDGEAGSRHAISAIVIAVPSRNDRETLQRLAVTEAIVTAVTLAVIAVFTVLLLRLGLRPLGNMAATATAIAGGDTNRRVPVDGAYTEVGRLAAALNHAFDQRQRAEDQLRGFIADASHELRTPLTTIRGWADLYFQGGLPDAAAIETAMSRIADEAGHVSRLVEELLLLARLDHQRPLGTDAVDLATIAREVAADAQVIDPQRPITLTLPQDSGEAVAVGDADRLRQVVRNLVGNALQHTPSGTPVQVSAGLDADDPVHWVRLSVADHGPGIPATDLPHVFERFYRSTRDSAGTGLGLAIVRAIVQAQGGTVQVWSEPGRGTRFDVTLPRAIDTAPARTVS